MAMKRVWALLAVVLMAILTLQPAVAVAQGSTSTISFQGELANSNGEPLSGSYNMRFAIYDGAGSLIWPTTVAFEQHDAVPVQDGLFNILLGSAGQPLSAFHFDGGSRYLQIWVCGTPEAGCTAYEPLDPRQPIPAVAYALVAQTLIPGARVNGASGDTLTIETSSENDGASAGTFLADGIDGETSAIYAENASQANGAAAGYFLAAEREEPHGDYGETYGVYAEARSSVGTGVYGEAYANLGTGVHGEGGLYGVYGKSITGSGHGLYSEGNAHVQGNLTVAGSVQSTQGGFTFPDGSILTSAPDIPAGIITMWSGSLANLPAGWALCNGSNGTPDLRDRFILGAATQTEMGDTGGSTSHGHITEGHSHWIIGPAEFLTSGWVADINLPPGGGVPIRYYAAVETGSTDTDHRHYVSIPNMESERSTVTVSTESHMPPYAKLAFIMKCGPNPANCPQP